MNPCEGETCITCGDVAVAVRVTELRPGELAVVATEAGPEEVSVALVDARVGDTILVHAKEAIAVTERAGGIEGLYPFLYAGDADIDALHAEVARSTAEKAAEIVTLRAQIGAAQADALAGCALAMAARFAAGGRLFCFGNGGSSTDAQAVTQMFCGAEQGGRPLPAIALTNDVAVLTALANDIGFEVVFARQLAAMAGPGDIAMGLSTSGGSANVLAGFAEARRRGALTVGLAGYDGGRMAEADTIDHLFVIPSSSVHRIQEAQTTVYDVLWELTQQALAN